MNANPVLRVIEAIVLLGIAIAFLAPLTTSEDENSRLPLLKLATESHQIEDVPI